MSEAVTTFDRALILQALEEQCARQGIPVREDDPVVLMRIAEIVWPEEFAAARREMARRTREKDGELGI